MVDSPEIATKPNVIEQYRKNLVYTFRAYLSPHIPKREDLRVLSVGCSFGYEAGAVEDVFGNGIKFTGIDINPKYIQAAKQMNTDLSGNVEFQIRDARKGDSYGDKKWDLIILRHPQVKEGILEPNRTSDWKIIVKNSLHALGKEGVMFVSADSEDERDTVAAWCKEEQGMVIKYCGENPYCSENVPFRDTYIMIAKKYDI